MDYEARLGRVISELRVLSGMTQAEFARRVHRSEPTISRWEGGRTIPSAVDIRAICLALDVPPDLLILPPNEALSPVEIRLRRAAAEGIRAATSPDAPDAPTPSDRRRLPRSGGHQG
jgi:transcriptional regulator with XRE-family HTH domain